MSIIGSETIVTPRLSLSDSPGMKESQFYGPTLSVNAVQRIPEMIGSFETDLRQFVSKHGDKWSSGQE